eukprot:gene23451-28450_t
MAAEKDFFRKVLDEDFEGPSVWAIIRNELCNYGTDYTTLDDSSPAPTPMMTGNARKRVRGSSPKRPSEDRLKKRNFIIRRNKMTPLERAVEDRQFLDRYRFTFSRLVSSDIRRLYSIMYTNVLNSGDPMLVRQFFRQFTVSRVQFFNYMASQVYNLPPILLTDQKAVEDVYVSFLDPKVDATTRLLETKVIRHYDTRTSDLSFLVRFTAHHVESVADNNAEEAGKIGDNSAVTVSTAHKIHVSAVDFYCKTTFSLNEANQITSIHLVGRNASDGQHMVGTRGNLMDELFPVTVVAIK